MSYTCSTPTFSYNQSIPTLDKPWVFTNFLQEKNKIEDRERQKRREREAQGKKWSPAYFKVNANPYSFFCFVLFLPSIFMVHIICRKYQARSLIIFGNILAAIGRREKLVYNNIKKKQGIFITMINGWTSSILCITKTETRI